MPFAACRATRVSWGGERLGGLWSAGARPGSCGCEFVGGTKHPGREVHFREGVVSGTQLFPRLDALTAAAQPGAIQEMGAGGFKRIGRVGMGGEGRLVRLHGGLVVPGGEPPHRATSARSHGGAAGGVTAANRSARAAASSRRPTAT
jgi:hypothetical protein